MDNRVNKIHETELRLVCDDSRKLPFEELVFKGNRVSINQKISPTEIFKAKQGTSTAIISDLSQFLKKPYNLRNNKMLQRKKKQNCFFIGTERILSLVPKIWEFLPELLKNAICLNSFKLKIKFWVTHKCSCKKYVGNMGFIYGCSVTCQFHYPRFWTFFFLFLPFNMLYFV